MKIKIKLRSRTSTGTNTRKERTVSRSSESNSSKHLVEQAISNLTAAAKLERCSVCKTWIESAKATVEDELKKLKYSQAIYNIMKMRGISKPWHELDDKIKEELKEEAKKGKI